MQAKIERTPPSSPRKLEEQRLRQETNGIFAPAKPGLFAPAKPGLFAEKRKELVERYVREELDAQQNQDDELIFEIEP